MINYWLSHKNFCASDRSSALSISSQWPDIRPKVVLGKITLSGLGDGECNEGSVWEAAMFAPAKQLNQDSRGDQAAFYFKKD